MVFRDVVSRIRWKSVFVLLLLIAVVAVVVYNPLDIEYKGSEYLKVRAWADPKSTDLRGESVIWVEIKNTGSEEMPVNVTLRTVDDKLIFTETDSQEKKVAIGNLGPGESRQLDSKAKLMNAQYGGEYRIDIDVISELENVSAKVFLQVSEKD